MGVDIPDPKEIGTNEEDYIKQFSEYAEYIKKIDPQQLNNPYHKHAKKIMSELNINSETTQKPEVPEDLFKNFMTSMKENDEKKANQKNNENTENESKIDLNKIMESEFDSTVDDIITENIESVEKL